MLSSYAECPPTLSYLLGMCILLNGNAKQQNGMCNTLFVLHKRKCVFHYPVEYVYDISGNILMQQPPVVPSRNETRGWVREVGNTFYFDLLFCCSVLKCFHLSIF